MGKDRTVLGSANRSTWASKFWPTGHNRFEKMCALAITGQLGGAQMCELDEHIAHCESCRKYLESVAQISVQVMPLLAEKHAPDRRLVPPPGMRERFLARLASEPASGENGKSLRPFSPADALQGRPRFKPIVEEKLHQVTRSKARFARSFRRPLAITTACLVAVASAYYAGTRKTVQSPPKLAEVHPSTPPTYIPVSPVTTTPMAPDRVNQLEQQKTDLETKLVAMRQELTTAQTERESLNHELAAAREKLAALTTQTANRPTEESHPASEQVSTLQADVNRLSQRLAESEIKFGIQKQENADLSSKLAFTESDLQRERDLKSAKSEMGELAASRNLHIVDVYDADPNGKRQRSFGRVFYIEDKSLVFYAYDLDDPGRFKSNVVFHVWGGKAGVKEVTHSLGILHRDDSGQNRWAMTFDDAKVLTQINSVFVTAESASKQSDQPHGKKVLYAYFGSPANHP
jgi:sugar-specific transcriptional regulator TrmB